MERTIAVFAGLFFFVNVMGCAAEEAGEPVTVEQDRQQQAVRAADLPSLFPASSGPSCLAGRYTSGWSTMELLPNGQGLRTERLHDGEHAKMAQGRFFWSATDRTITLGLEEQPMRVETDCRFVWIGDAMFTRTVQ